MTREEAVGEEEVQAEESEVIGGRSWEGGGWRAQEVDGPGGRGLRVRRVVRLGGEVDEEASDGGRAWCGWCDRVVLGEGDE